MVLKMASPHKDPKSGIFYLRVRVPDDILGKVKGQSVSLPVDGAIINAKIGEAVKVSLRTHDPREAKVRFGIANASLNDFWRAVRRGPQKLSQKESVALSGDIYRTFVTILEQNPGTYEQWATVLEDNEAAQAGDYGRGALMIGHNAKVQRSMEDRFGGLTDALLRSKGLIIDKESRDRVLTEVGKALNQAASQLKKNADGDYSPDPRANRFPAFDKQSEKQASSLTMTALFEA